MSELVIKKHGGHKFYLKEIYAGLPLGSVIGALLGSKRSPNKVLSGRGYVSSVVIEDVGPIIVKHYRRGGILRFVNSQRYLRGLRLRPQVEFELLEQVRSVGISTPEPIGYVRQGSIFYKGWLLIKEIEHQQSLAEISLSDPERAERLMAKFNQQVVRLIENNIYHVDLHAGNILVDHDDNVFLIDFDKARGFKGRRNKLRDFYLCRWRRAVIKHKLPEFLSELFCVGIRRDFNVSSESNG